VKYGLPLTASNVHEISKQFLVYIPNTKLHWHSQSSSGN